MILLDTHIALWLAYEPERLSDDAADAIEEAESQTSAIALSAASVYELIWLFDNRRLKVPNGVDEFVQELNRRFFVLPIDGGLAVRAARIPTPFHGDPMDRLIVATALESGRTLITADRAILSSKACKLLW